MRILLDENIPVQLRTYLTRHDVASINDPSLGWKNIKNGLLLQRMSGRYDLLITADQNIYDQQNLTDRPFSILVLPTNRRQTVLAQGHAIAALVEKIGAGQYVVTTLSGGVSVTLLAPPE